MGRIETRSILRKTTVALACVMAASTALAEEVSLRPRDYGIEIGVLQPGANNAITDVAGVLVGQVNVHDDKKGAHTGVTAILPHGGNIFKEKVPAGIFLGNAFGKMAGYPQVKELGNIETPIVLTNTLNIAAGLDGIIDYTFSFADNKGRQERQRHRGRNQRRRHQRHPRALCDEQGRSQGHSNGQIRPRGGRRRGGGLGHQGLRL